MNSTQSVTQATFEDAEIHPVIDAVATEAGCGPLDLPPLYETVDPEALRAVLRSAPRCRVTFEYAGYRVTVDADGGTDVDELA